MKVVNKRNLIETIMIFLIFSILGWIWELIFDLLTTGVLSNHGVLLGPWLPIYGFGTIFVYLLLRKYKNPVIIFMGSFVICTIIEYCTAFYLETFLHKSWWDYSSIPFNIQGRICLIASCFFGILGLIVVFIAIPRIKKLFLKISLKKLTIVCLIVLTIFLIDKIRSYKYPNIGKRYHVIKVPVIDEIKMIKNRSSN